MKALKLLACAVLLSTAALTGVRADDPAESAGQDAARQSLIPRPTLILSVAEIARRVQSGNLELIKAARRVERARQDLVGEPELMDSSLSVGGGYASSGIPGSAGWYGQSRLLLPLSPQLSAGGEISVDDEWQLEEELSLSVRPLVPRRQTYDESRSYAIALVEERYLRQAVYLGAEQAALSLLIRDMESELDRSTLELEQKKYQLVQRRQDLGEASFQDVQDGLVDLIEARQSLFNSEQRYLSDWKTLQLLFAPSEERIGVKPLSDRELLERISARRTESDRHRDREPVTGKLETSRLELNALQQELDATPAWRPDLSLSAALALPEASPSASLSLSFSPNQLKGDERQELREDMEIKRLEIAAESYTATLQETLGRQSIAIAEEVLSSARIQRERDRVALQEGELLFQQGRRTTLELEQLRLNLRAAEILSFQAAVALYGTLGEYLMLFVGE
ncbi:MAG: hypothetical protein JXB06_15745 [Spirochaetales bacterium]|nr:hypothetical protein [Spirochaetales bacterium]